MRKGERRGSLTDTSDGTLSEMGSDDDYGGHPEDTESEDEPILECHSASAGPVRPRFPITGPVYRPLTVPNTTLSPTQTVYWRRRATAAATGAPMGDSARAASCGAAGLRGSPPAARRRKHFNVIDCGALSWDACADCPAISPVRDRRKT
jgi:hypothetical protein